MKFERKTTPLPSTRTCNTCLSSAFCKHYSKTKFNPNSTSCTAQNMGLQGSYEIDYITYSDMRIITNDTGLTIEANIRLIDKQIAYIKNEILNNNDIKNFIEMPINSHKATKTTVTKEAMLAEIDYMYSLLNSLLSETPPVNLFDFMSITKSGKFNKNKHPILYISKYGTIEQYEYTAATAIMLHAEPMPINFRGDCDNTRMQLSIEYRAFDIVNNISYLQDINNPILPSATPKAIRNNSLKPGYIYENPKGAKYLYLGKGSHMTIKNDKAPHTFSSIEEYEKYINKIPYMYRQYFNVEGFMYIQINKRLEKILNSKTLTYTDFFNELLANKKEPTIRQTQAPKKMIKECHQALTDMPTQQVNILFDYKITATNKVKAGFSIKIK